MLGNSSEAPGGEPAADAGAHDPGQYHPAYGPPGHYPGQPGYGQPGYGQYPSRGQYAPAGTDDAPRPGGIPLRPLGMGDILGGAFTSVRRNPAATLGLSAILLTCNALLSTGLLLILRATAGPLRSLNITAGQPLTRTQARRLISQVLGVLIPAAAITLILALLVEILLTGLLTVVIGRGALGRKVGAGAAWRLALPRLPALLGVAVLILLIVLAPWAATAAVVVAAALAHAGAAAAGIGVLCGLAALACTVWFSVMLSMAAPVTVLERQPPAAAIGRSWRLVRGSFWRVLGITLFAALIVAVADAIIRLPFTSAATASGGSGGLLGVSGRVAIAAVVISAVGTIVAGALTRPVSAGVSVLIYTDLRMRREQLGGALIAAAGSGPLTGDEFATAWQPPGPTNPAPGTMPGGWPSAAPPG
jgi:hypothetical protein